MAVAGALAKVTVRFAAKVRGDPRWQRNSTPTEEARRRLRRGRDTLANGEPVIVVPTEGDVGVDKRLGLSTGPQGDEPARKLAPPRRWYWPGANAHRAPSRPQGRKKSLE